MVFVSVSVLVLVIFFVSVSVQVTVSGCQFGAAKTEVANRPSVSSDRVDMLATERRQSGEGGKVT